MERRSTVTANEQVQAIGALETYVTENLGRLTAPTPPALFNAAPTSLAEPSPGHGQHSRAIMEELGFDVDTVEDMAQKAHFYAPDRSTLEAALPHAEMPRRKY